MNFVPLVNRTGYGHQEASRGDHHQTLVHHVVETNPPAGVSTQPERNRVVGRGRAGEHADRGRRGGAGPVSSLRSAVPPRPRAATAHPETARTRAARTRSTTASAPRTPACRPAPAATPLPRRPPRRAHHSRRSRTPAATPARSSPRPDPN